MKNKTANILCALGYNLTEKAVTNTNKKDGIFQLSSDRKK
jgi:hypothetical protein